MIALGNSIGTGAKSVTAPVVLINNFDELEQKKDQVRGRSFSIIINSIPGLSTLLRLMEMLLSIGRRGLPGPPGMGR
ncbi:hypothetical protein KRR40_19375 [Niabella defluvii]|nr:hypothetical protein KRR40_19375 [Niabella sp. I65]